MGSPTYRLEIEAAKGTCLRPRVTAANNSDQRIPTEKRFPLLALCECHHLMISCHFTTAGAGLLFQQS